jgi:hypothetical protein
MKKYQIIDKAIHEVGAGQIARYRRSPALALLLLIFGIAIVASVWAFGIVAISQTAARAMVVAGGLVFVAGVIRAILDFNTKKLYYKPSGSQMRRYERIFDAPYLMKVCQCLDEGDFAALSRLPHGHSPSVKAIIYKADDDAVMAGQAFGYQKPVTETKLFERGSFTVSERFA